MSDRLFFTLMLLVFSVVFIWSSIHPSDRFTWFLEVFPAILALVILAATYRRFKFTRLAYVLICLHAFILLVGGHYTYAEVPLFDWIRDTFDLSRNHYDRVGHFAQGFSPAIVTREILLRLTPLKRGGWLFSLVCCVCLAISASYELIEWWVAVWTSSEHGQAFLGTQGDVWDTQWDMFLALTGAILAQVTLARAHDRQLRAVCQGKEVNNGN